MLRLFLFLVILTGILLGVGFLIGGIVGMTFALIFAFFINFLSYWYSDRIVLSIYNACPLDNKELENMVERLAREAKIAKPKLYIIDSEVPNAFATGRDDKHAVIAITRGLMRLEKNEIEGVLSHEISHIKNKDILISTIAAVIAGAISYLAQIGYWSLFLSDERRSEASIIGLFFIIIFAPLAAMLLRMAISRNREYLADYTGAILTKKPQYLASALRKIHTMAMHYPMRGNVATAHMWIVNPFKGDWFTALFSTHPPIERRIERLENMAHPE
ncbi:MAG TPA: protease [Candidatus Aenigmarchaeota archaeon]|nr:protease [Candidatus Aenigmarchaeota archaeon]